MISRVVTRGFGSHGSIPFVVTRGYGVGAFVPPVVTTQTPAGRSRRRILVEIDGEDFEVGSYEEAVEIFSEVKKLAQKTAPKVVKQENALAVKEVKGLSLLRSVIPEFRIKSEVPKDFGPIEKLVDTTSLQVKSIYQKAARREIERLQKEIDEYYRMEEEVIAVMMFL